MRFRDFTVHCIGTKSNHRDMRRGRIFSQDSERLDTAEARQIDVHQDDIRPGSARNLDPDNTLLSSLDYASREAV